MWKLITKEKLLNLFNGGETFESIGETYGITSRSVRYKCEKFGIVRERTNQSPKKIVCKCKQCSNVFEVTRFKEFCTSNCASLFSNLVEPIRQDAETNLGKSILKLREQGYSYNQIVEKIGCSKSTVSYYCTKNSPVKKLSDRKRNHKYKAFVTQLSNYKGASYTPRKISKKLGGRRKMLQSIVRFRKRAGAMREDFTYQEAIEHIGGDITKCYLTGDIINIKEDDFHLDHIHPISRGGSNALSNLGITIPRANQAKHNMTVDELLELCSKILKNHGYTVSKK